jgi:hypothetical protein
MYAMLEQRGLERQLVPAFLSNSWNWEFGMTKSPKATAFFVLWWFS